MNNSKEMWIAVVVAIVVLALFFGAMFFYSNQPASDLSSEMVNGPGVASNSTPGIAQTMPNGLIIQDLIVGTGVEAKAGNLVTVNYVGMLEDGTVFDSSFSRNQPFSFPLGTGQVIPGWDQGVAGMKVGGNRKLVIPASLAYGAAGTPDGSIPPNATLTFEVTLLNVQ